MTERKEPSCTNCGAPAQYVAADDSGLAWFECGAHDANDNLAGSPRVKLEPIAEWRAGFTSCPTSAIRREQLELARHLRSLGDNELASLIELMTPVELNTPEVEP